MKELKFEIYIGKNLFQGQAESVVAGVIPKFFIPNGKCKLDGSLIQNENTIYFNRIYDVGTYFADWFDLVGDTKTMKAIIYLNKFSTYKTFVGHEIIDIIDKIEKNPDYLELRTFDELK